MISCTSVGVILVATMFPPMVEVVLKSEVSAGCSWVIVSVIGWEIELMQSRPAKVLSSSSVESSGFVLLFSAAAHSLGLT
jgi:hypothetical protein